MSTWNVKQWNYSITKLLISKVIDMGPHSNWERVFGINFHTDEFWHHAQPLIQGPYQHLYVIIPLYACIGPSLGIIQITYNCIMQLIRPRKSMFFYLYGKRLKVLNLTSSFFVYIFYTIERQTSNFEISIELWNSVNMMKEVNENPIFPGSIISITLFQFQQDRIFHMLLWCKSVHIHYYEHRTNIE